jgi:hypothetical protein
MEEENIKTFEEAVNYVADRIEKDTVSSPYFHFSGGMNMRNFLGLWNKESALYKHMLERFGLCHADDTGMIISHAAHCKKNDLPYSPLYDVETCKQHWINLGLDPATMEKLKG